MADITISAGGSTLTIGTVGVSGGDGVELFTTAAALLAASRADGHIGYASDTDVHYLRQNGAWAGPVLVTQPDTGVKVYATSTALLAATLADGRVAYATDIGAHYFRQAGAWQGPIPTAQNTGAVTVVATEATLLATGSVDATLSYATDTGRLYQREASTWGRTLASKFIGRTLAQIITAVGSTRTTVFIDRPITAGGGSTVTVPKNLRLCRIDDGRIIVASGQTVDLKCMPLSDAATLFTFTDSTSHVTFSTSGTGLILPEWFGAVGDFVTHDAAAWQRMLDAIAGPLNLESVIDMRGRSYYIDSQLAVSPASTGRLHILAQGGYFKAGAIHGGVLKLGDQAGSKKLYWSMIHGLAISRDQAVSQFSDSAALQIDRADFGNFVDLRLDGFKYGVHGTGEGGNSNHFTDVSISGCVEGANLGLDCDNFNNWSFNGGKIQQCTIGVHGSGVGVNIGTGKVVDFSLHSVSAVKLENSAEVHIKLYTEGIGNGLDSNDSKVVHLINCHRGSILDGRINGANGGSYTANCGHGIYHEGCTGIRIDGNAFVGMQKEDVYYDSACDETNEIGRRNELDMTGNDLVAFDTTKLIRVSDNTPRGVRNEARTVLMPTWYDAAATNAIVNPNDFSQAEWSLLGGATISGTIEGPRPGQTADILDFPNNPFAGNTALLSRLELAAAKDMGTSLDGKIIALRYCYLPLDVINASIYDQHRLMTTLQRTTDANYFGASGCFDRKDRWQFAEHRYTVPTVGGNPHTMGGVRFSSSGYGPDAIRVAIYGVQLVVLATAQTRIPYLFGFEGK